MELGLGWTAAVAALASAVFVFFQVREMQRQTRLQREVVESSAQPYVWLDVRVQPANGWFLELVVGNSGPTVATDIRVEIEPPFVDMAHSKGIEAAQTLLRDGLTSLAPGREISWQLGVSHEVIASAEASAPRRVSIRALGPFGPLPVSTYVIALQQVRESIAHRPGTLHEIAESVKKVADKLPD